MTSYQLPKDAVWFITGCSSGIGLSLAQLIAQTPNRIVATARNPNSLSSLPDTANVLKLPLDVTSLSSVDDALSATIKAFGRIDVLVNNAGYGLMGDTESASVEESRAIMDANFWGMVDVTKRVLPVFREANAQAGQQGGIVFNVSSMGGWAGYPGQAFYHASKFAMEGWTESVAKELPAAWNIHFCLIEPGGVKTNYATSSMKMMEKRHPAYADPTFPTNALAEYISNEQVQHGWADPKDVAKAVYLVASRGQGIPLRVPLGADAWGAIMADLEGMTKAMGEVKEISLNVGGERQAATLDFLGALGAT